MQLASSHLAFAHGRLSVVWLESGRDASGKCSFSLRQFRAAAAALEFHDRSVLAERAGRRAFRAASAPRGIRRVDCGTQGRVERIFLHADALVLRSARKKTNRRRRCKISEEQLLQAFMAL